MRIGFSTTTIGCSLDLDRLAQFQPESLELCRCGTADWPRLARLIKASPIPVGLHAPIPYDGHPRRFEITGPTAAGMREALGLVRRTVNAAVDTGAAYVVVHFPTPHPRSSAGGSRPAADDGRVLEAGAALADMRVRTGVPLLLENMSFNPQFGTAEHYRKILTRFPELRLCLDLGHAHISPHAGDVDAFTSAVAPFISSVHLYNTSRASDRAGDHEVPSLHQVAEDGWMNLPRLLRTLAEQARPDYLVFEYTLGDGDSAADAHRSVSWLRQVIEELRWS